MQTRDTNNKKHIKNDKFLDAHTKALGAYALGANPRTRQQAVREAKEALAISDALCVDAYAVLAMFESNTYEEALSLFKKGIEVSHAMFETFDSTFCCL